MENLTHQDFILILSLGWFLSMLYDIIVSIINAINERAWVVKDYEKIIANNLGTYDTDDFKEKKLIANAKENVEKRNKNRQKIKKIFSKGKKNDR